MILFIGPLTYLITSLGQACPRLPNKTTIYLSDHSKVYSLLFYILTGELMRELTHNILSEDVANDTCGGLIGVSVRGDVLLTGGAGGAAIFRLVY